MTMTLSTPDLSLKKHLSLASGKETSLAMYDFVARKNNRLSISACLACVVPRVGEECKHTA